MIAMEAFMLLIEFNGLPGSGKSTVSKQICNLLKETDNSCLFTELGSTSYIQRVLNILRFNPIEIWHLYRICKLNYGRIDRTLFSRIIYSEQILGKYRRLKRKDGYCVVDQGIVQTILSIFYISEVSNWDKIDNHIISIITKYIDNTIFVNSVIDINTSLGRIRSRKEGRGTRYDKITSDEELYSALEHQLVTINHVRDLLKKIDCIVMININMLDSVEQNCGTVVSVMQSIENSREA